MHISISILTLIAIAAALMIADKIVCSYFERKQAEREAAEQREKEIEELLSRLPKDSAYKMREVVSALRIESEFLESFAAFGTKVDDAGKAIEKTFAFLTKQKKYNDERYNAKSER